MCIRINERYAVCKCVYYVHGVDPCQSVGQFNHSIQDKTVLVGYACTMHAPCSPQHSSISMMSPRIGVLPDSLSTSSSTSGSYYSH